jgi:hypothetical protein
MRWTWFRIRIATLVVALFVAMIAKGWTRCSGEEPVRAQPDPTQIEAQQLVAQLEAECGKRPELLRKLVQLRSDVAKLTQKETALARNRGGSATMDDAAKAVDDAADHVIAADTACLDGLAAHPIDVAKCGGADEALDVLVAKRHLFSAALPDVSSLRSSDATLDEATTTLGRDTFADDLAKIDGCP